MSKIRTLVQHLAQEEYTKLYKQFIDADAVKSSIVLNHLRQGKISEEDIRLKMKLQESAFYTICSRLTDKIDDFVLESSNSRITQLISRVSGLDDIVLNQDRFVAISCLKKLERDLKRHDLNRELAAVYRALKRLHLNDSKYFEYRQKYNEQNTIVWAFDDFEDNLSNYVKAYSAYIMCYELKKEPVFDVYITEFENLTELYPSLRIKTLFFLTKVFHDIFLKEYPLTFQAIKSLNERLEEVEKAVKKHTSDSFFFAYGVITQYYRLLLYFKIDTSHNALGHLFSRLAPVEHLLFGAYGSLAFTNYYFNLKLRFYAEELILGTVVFDTSRVSQLILDQQDLLKVVHLCTYRIILLYYKKMFLEANRLFDQFYANATLAKYTKIGVDFKLLEAVVRLKSGDVEKSVRLSDYAKRQLVKLANGERNYALRLLELLQLFNGASAYNINSKASLLVKQFNIEVKPIYSPLFGLQLNYDDYKVV